MVLRRRQRQRIVAVAQHEERGFLAGQEFFDHRLRTGRAEAAAEHHVDSVFRLRNGHRHHDALAGGKPVRLDHDRSPHLPDIGLGLGGIAEALIGGGWNSVGLAEVLGEPLRTLELGGSLARAERLETGSGEVIDDADGERRFRPDHHKIHLVGLAEIDHGLMVCDIERDAFGLLRDPGIARGAPQFGQQWRAGDFPGQRMFASTGAEKKDVHGSLLIRPVNGSGQPRQEAGWALPGPLDDLPQQRHVAGKCSPANGGRGDLGLGLFPDKGFIDSDIGRFGQGFDVGTEITVGGAGQGLQPGELQPLAGRQRVERGHDSKPQRLMNDVVELCHGSAPAHPEAAQHKPAAIDHRHPQLEPGADEEIADKRQRGDAKADRHEREPDP